MYHLMFCRKKRKISCNDRRQKGRPILKALRMARADAGLTISELAERAGVSRDTISNAEKGRHGLQASTLHKIARALGKAPSELLAEEERLAPKLESRSSLEPSLFNGLEKEGREMEPGVAGLFRNLAKRARLIADTSRRQGGPSAELGEQVELFYEEVAHVLALRRLLPRWGAESDELADAEDAYEEAERAIQAMIRQDLEATDEERREARRFQSGAEDARGRREADAS
jgi:transcriptional regulator with XRE-family HTH domain